MSRDFAGETAEQKRILAKVGAQYGKHSGPGSDERKRATFLRDLRTAALRYARAYYAEARELGLIPEYERAPSAAVLRGLQCIRMHLDDGGHDWRAGTAMVDVVAARTWLDTITPANEEA